MPENKNETVFCWKDGSRVHLYVDGPNCVCLMPAGDMEEFSQAFPFGFGLKECESCRTLHTAQSKFHKTASTRGRKKLSTRRKIEKQYEKRLAKQKKAVDAKLGFTKLSVASRPDFYQTPAWKKIRYSALRKNDGKCELCGASKATGAILHVDHIKPRSKYPELSLTLSNLQILCGDCNMGKGNTDSIDWRRK